jgi:hypothetical protein
MGLLQDIQNATIDPERPLAAVLRMTKMLATRLDNHLLMEWVDHELTGYPEDGPLPAYRERRQALVLGKFTNGFWQVSNVEIPPSAVDEQFRDGWLFHITYSNSVGDYEAMLQAQPEGDFRFPWPLDAIAVLQPQPLRDMNCMQAWRVLPRVEVMGVLEGVRNRLLDLVLKLEREAPDAGEVPSSTLPISTEQITNIVAATIYAGSSTVTDNSISVHGTAGNIAGGQGNRTRQGDVSIQHGVDLARLAGAVRAAVALLDSHLPPEQLDAIQGLVEDVEEEAAAQRPAHQRLVRTLKGITALAAAAGSAGAAVIDAAQAMQRAIGR